MNLFITADRIGTSTGGGIVTHHELLALQGLGQVTVINPPMLADPFAADEIALKEYQSQKNKYTLAHFYAGSYPKLAAALKADGVLVSYTAAAHDVEASRREHEALGYGYDYPHLTNPDLLNRYLASYRAADVVICPSRHSEGVMRRFGCSRIVVVPHGCEPVAEVAPLPKQFVVGYLGQPGPDKGLRHLFAAWKKLNYPDARLVVAGRNTQLLAPLVGAVGGGNVYLAGFVQSPSWLYNQCSVYVQPSVTEGFGIEVLEAMVHGRPVICSSGAGAVDFVDYDINGIVVPPGDSNALAYAIDHYKGRPELIARHGQNAIQTAKSATWESVRRLYQETWREMCSRAVTH